MWKMLLAVFIHRAGETMAQAIADAICEVLSEAAQQRGCSVDDLIARVIERATDGRIKIDELER